MSIRVELCIQGRDFYSSFKLGMVPLFARMAAGALILVALAIQHEGQLLSTLSGNSDNCDFRFAIADCK